MNRATKINVVITGMIFGLSGMTHGCSETLQGNTPTNGFLINAIAAGSRWTRWVEGGEGAFTIIPNFLLTGILAMLVGLAIIVWSVGFVHRPRGPLVFLLLFVLLFLVGGGIGQVIFFIPAWAVATRIHQPLTWWRNRMPAGVRRGLALAWPWLLAAAAALILSALIVAIYGYLPGVRDMEQVLNLTLAMVGAAWLLFLLAFVAGFARDSKSSNAQFAGSIPASEKTMSPSILVTYATRYGSTQAVAEAVAAELRAFGLAVEIQPMGKVKTLNGYQQIVLGAPIYIGRLEKDARRFLAQHQNALQTRPVALFALGPTTTKEEDWRDVRTQFEQILAQLSWLKPVAVELFGGKFDPTAFRFPDTLLTFFPASPIRNMPASDVRDWTAIRAWAKHLAAQFQPVLSHEGVGKDESPGG